MKSKQTITIPMSDYEDLLTLYFWSVALEQAGVVQWEGFKRAEDIFHRTVVRKVLEATKRNDTTVVH